jgi:uncharacterized protein HemX
VPDQVPTQVWKLSEYGVAGIVLAVVLVCAITLVAWLLKQFEKNAQRLDAAQDRLDADHERMSNERVKWFEITTMLKSAIDSNAGVVQAHNSRADEAAKYVREEHGKMCEALNKQNESLVLLVQELKLKPCIAKE